MLDIKKINGGTCGRVSVNLKLGKKHKNLLTNNNQQMDGKNKQEEEALLAIKMWWMRRKLNAMWIEIYILGKNSFFLDRFLTMGREYLDLEDGHNN